MEEDIEELLKRKDDYDFAYGTQIYRPYTMNEKDWELIENLLTRYKELDSLLGEIDNKEVSDALHMLLHCSLKDTEYETQKEQFKIVNAYIKKLEKDNEEWQRAYQEEKDKQFELLRENKELKEEECCMATCLRKDKERVFFENKVKEKIEEYKKVIEITEEKLKHEENVDVRKRLTTTIEQATAGILALEDLLREE